MRVGSVEAGKVNKTKGPMRAEEEGARSRGTWKGPCRSPLPHTSSHAAQGCWATAIASASASAHTYLPHVDPRRILTISSLRTLFICCVTLGQLLNLSGPWCPHLLSGYGDDKLFTKITGI